MKALTFFLLIILLSIAAFGQGNWQGLSSNESFTGFDLADAVQDGIFPTRGTFPQSLEMLTKSDVLNYCPVSIPDAIQYSEIVTKSDITVYDVNIPVTYDINNNTKAGACAGTGSTYSMYFMFIDGINFGSKVSFDPLIINGAQYPIWVGNAAGGGQAIKVSSSFVILDTENCP